MRILWFCTVLTWLGSNASAGKIQDLVNDGLATASISRSSINTIIGDNDPSTLRQMLHALNERMIALELQSTRIQEENQHFKEEILRIRNENEATLGECRRLTTTLQHQQERQQRQEQMVVAFDLYSSKIFDQPRQVISYAGALVNLGSGVDDPAEGVFRAPVPGVYAFNFNFDERDGDTARIQIRVNGVAVATVASYEPSDDSSSGESVVVQLRAGDEVDSYLLSGSIGGDSDTHFNGFLIAEIF